MRIDTVSKLQYFINVAHIRQKTFDEEKNVENLRPNSVISSKFSLMKVG